MADRPILFSAPMIRALNNGKKTQTRRILSPQPQTFLVDDAECEVQPVHVEGEDAPRIATGRVITAQKLRFAKGDRLWCKETWRAHVSHDALKPIHVPPFHRIWYEADERDNCDQHGKARPSIFMPRWASRLTLAVTDVRVERLQNISRADAIAEGLTLASNIIGEFWRWPEPHHEGLWLSPPAAYRSLWNEINGKGAWDANPFVVAISFEVHKCNIDQMGERPCPTVTASSPS